MNSFWLFLGFVTFLVVVVVVVVVIIDDVVLVRDNGATVFVSRINLSIFSWFSLFFQQATLIFFNFFVFFIVVARWFVSVGIDRCGMLAHGVYL